MRFLFGLILSIFCLSVYAADAPVAPIKPRVSIFSTTVDWAAVTGLRLRQYTGQISGTDKNLVKDGLVLYYLDSFPCYGEADSVRVWLSPKGKMSGNLRLVCLYKPEYISFAWRNANEDALDSRTTGILKCPVDGKYDLKIDITKCEIGPDWTEYK